MTPAEFHAARRFAETPSGRIAYVQKGTGAAALFVHGFPLNGYHWRHALDALSAERRCIAPDLMGLGHSEVAADQDLSFGAQAGMMLELVDALGVGEFDLVGNDSGGAVAQIIAATAPARVRSLVLTNCDTEDNTQPEALTATLESARRGVLGDALAMILSRPELARRPQSLGATFERPEALSDETLAVYLAPLTATPERRRQVDRYALAIGPEPLERVREALQRLRVPTLLAWGDADVFFPPEGARWLATTIPGVRRLEILKGAKLFWPEERPEAFASLVRGHWAAAGAPQPA
jgi:haloalkane dehalogenase